MLTCYVYSTKIGEISDISKCFENFVSQALGVLTRIYAAELRELIETCLFDIIHTEDTTGRFIRLYGAGDYWHAFEESAYQLSQLFVTHDVTVLRHKVYPFPVLMVSISDDELQAYGKNHIFRKKVSGYRELVGIGISMKRYKEWHKKEVMKFSSLP